MTTNTRHPSVEALLQWFEFSHLPPELADVSAPCAGLAHEIVSQCDDSQELAAGLRKLLEAKDCFVRAKLMTRPELPPVEFWQLADSDEPMGFHPVESSNVALVGFEAVDRTGGDLLVAFKSSDDEGPTFYRYAGVPVQVWAKLCSVIARGDSVGKFISDYVKKAPYDYVKIGKGEPVDAPEGEEATQ